MDKTRNIVYSDGECTFDIVRYVEENIIEVKANESHTIYDRKSLSIGHIEKRERLPQDILELISNVKFDSIALSFVTNSKEVKYFKSLFPQVNIISKIECPQGIAEVEKISKISDVMLGRGDLCLTSDCFNLYCYQKKIAKICKKNRCKFYVATGILSSLCKQSIPSQADIIDVSNLLLLSPDFIVLNFPLIYSKHNLALKTIENIFQRVV